jgi:hypothetical protein
MDDWLHAEKEIRRAEEMFGSPVLQLLHDG